uniref:Uncharacterized protein n=1 Tax=Megaselia scalaris TaxID=36166 RepID=T1GU52_MEGSC
MTNMIERSKKKLIRNVSRGILVATVRNTEPKGRRPQCYTGKRSKEKEETHKLEVWRESNRKFCQDVIKRRNGYTPLTSFCNDKSGKLITENR